MGSRADALEQASAEFTRLAPPASEFDLKMRATFVELSHLRYSRVYPLRISTFSLLSRFTRELLLYCYTAGWWQPWQQNTVIAG